jgi:hypothetical protein
MKTTNFENSKKLSELGFEAKSDYIWVNSRGKITCEHTLYFSDHMSSGEVICSSWDLETILENLCFVIEDLENKKVFWFKMDQQNMEYTTFEGDTSIEFYKPRQKDESIVDCAARLLISLYEKEIIKSQISLRESGVTNN